MGRTLFSLLVIATFLLVVAPLLLPVAMGAVLAVLLAPLVERLQKRKLGTGFASALVTLGMTVLIVLPGATLVFVGAKAGFKQVKVWREAPRAAGDTPFEAIVNSPGAQRAIDTVTAWLPLDAAELLQAAQDLAKAVSLKFADLLGDFVARLPGMTMALAIMVVSVYFFLVDGPKVVRLVRRNSVLSSEQTERMIGSFGGMCRSVILAAVVSGFAQSFVFGVACVVSGVPNTPLIALLAFLASFIPLVGSAPITFGVGIHQLVTVSRGVGITLLIVALLVTVLDNLVRPMVLKGGGNLHPLLGFIAAFGGLQTLGFAGVFIGPILAGLFVATLEMLLQDAAKA